jgi:hypothetical protein
LIKCKRIIKDLSLNFSPSPSLVPVASVRPTSIPSTQTTVFSTADWKTYTGDKLKFSFNYPQDLVYTFNYLDDYAVKGNPSGNFLLQNFQDKQDTQITNTDFQFAIFVSKDGGMILTELAKNAGSKIITNMTLGG